MNATQNMNISIEARTSRLRNRRLGVSPHALTPSNELAQRVEDGERVKDWHKRLENSATEILDVQSLAASATATETLPSFIDFTAAALKDKPDVTLQEAADAYAMLEIMVEGRKSLTRKVRRLALKRLAANNRVVLVHQLDCIRYGANGDSSTRHCACVRHITQKHADDLVDVGFVVWLKAKRNGRVYRTRKAVVQIVEPIAPPPSPPYSISGGYGADELGYVAVNQNDDSLEMTQLKRDVDAIIENRSPLNKQIALVYRKDRSRRGNEGRVGAAGFRKGVSGGLTYSDFGKVKKAARSWSIGSGPNSFEESVEAAHTAEQRHHQPDAAQVNVEEKNDDPELRNSDTPEMEEDANEDRRRVAKGLSARLTQERCEQ